MDEAQKATRRQFLRGKIVPLSDDGDLLGNGGSADLDGHAAQGGSPDPTADPYLVRVGRRAMACQFQIFFSAGVRADCATENAIAALDLVEQLEDVFSVYREGSEVSLINRTAHAAAASTGTDVYRLLRMSQTLYAETDGAFDVTSGPLSEVWGFARRSGRLPGQSELAEALASVGMQYVHVEEESRSVKFLRPGVQLNFGGIGKGYALDRAAELLEAAGVHDFLIHGGRSSVLARGKRSDGGGQLLPWRVGVIHPQRPDQRLAEIALRDCALSTSGSQMQSFHLQGRRYGHILDPRTGWPAEGLLSATVLAGSAAEADALSTGLFVLGREGAVRFCQKHPQIRAVLVLAGDRSGSVKVEAHGLEDDDWHLLIKTIDE